MRFVGEHDDVRALTQHFGGLELVHEGEHVALVARQQFAQMRSTGGVTVCGLAHGADGLEGLGNLLVQLHAVGHDDEGPVARQSAQHLLREEHHGEALAAALRLPEHAAAPVPALPGLQHGGDGIVHAEELVVLRQHLHQRRLVLGEQGEVLHQIQQPGWLAGAPQHHFQRHAPGLVLALDALPLHPALPVGGERAHAAVGAVAGNHQRIEDKQRRDLILVVREVLVEGRPRRHAGLLEFNHHPRQAVDEAHQVRPAGVERAGHAELAYQQEVIAGGVGPVDHA